MLKFFQKPLQIFAAVFLIINQFLPLVPILSFAEKVNAATPPTVNTLITNNNLPTLTGTCSGPIANIVQIIVPGFFTDNNHCTSSNTWSSTAISPISDGTYNVSVEDPLGSGNFDTTTNELTVDTVAPTVTLNQKIGQPDPTSVNPINFTAVFSEPVDPATVTAADFVISSLPGTGIGVIGTPTTNDNITWNIPVTVTTAGDITLNITGSAINDLAGNSLGSLSSTDRLVKFTAAPNVTFTKTSNSALTRNVGDTITSTLIVGNSGLANATGVQISDPIPSNPPGNTRTWTLVQSGGVTPALTSSGTGNILLSGITIPPNDVITITVNDTVTSNSGGYMNNADVTGGGLPISGIHQSVGPITFVTPPVVTITKSTAGATTRLAGEVITSTIVVTNTGATTATSQIVSDPIPSTPAGTTRTFTKTKVGLITGDSSTSPGAINDTLTIPVGGSITYTVNDTVVNTGTYQNSATLNAGAPVTGNSITINPSAKLKLTKVVSNTHGGSAVVGNFTLYDIETSGSTTRASGVVNIVKPGVHELEEAPFAGYSLTSQHIQLMLQILLN